MAVCSSLGFIALPGGYGVSQLFVFRFEVTELTKILLLQTFEEVLEMVTWTQLRIRESYSPQSYH